METFKSYVKKPNVAETLEFIKHAHEGQKYGSEPYWTHPKAVADLGKKLFGASFTTEAYMAALMHDVIEDTEYTLDDLKQSGYSEAVLDAVKLLTKDKHLSYEDNIKKIINNSIQSYKTAYICY